MKVIIRDDDISFTSDHRDIEKVYGYAFKNNIPINLAIVPMVKQGENELLLTRNIDLCKYLKKLFREKKISVMLHGYNHTKDEFLKMKESNILDKISKGKKILDNLFQTQIKYFVPPNNSLSHEAGKKINDYGLDIITSFHKYYFKNPIDYIKNIKILLKKFKNGIYPEQLMNNKRKIYFCDEEVFGLKLGRYKKANKNLEFAIKRHRIFKAKNQNFILSNHYWDIKSRDKEIAQFNTFLSNLKKEGTRFVKLE